MEPVDRTLDEIVRTTPGAAALLAAHGFDVCSAGARTLRSVALERGVRVEDLVRQLETPCSSASPDARDETPRANASPDEHDWSNATADELIDHILARYHQRHRQQLPELVRLARTVERVHGGNPDCPRGIAVELALMQEDLEQHMNKEEGILFPMIRRGFLPRGPISVMRSEHDRHGATLRQLAGLTRDFHLPADACPTWTALMSGLRALRVDLMQHIQLENDVLFEPGAGR